MARSLQLNTNLAPMTLPEFSQRMEERNGYLWLTLVLAAVLSFWKLGDHHVQVWDEARQGVTALEMLEGCAGSRR